MMSDGRWIGGGGRPAAGAPEVLFCFPHAGGGPAFFRPWSTALAGDIDVRPIQLPGREARLHEPPLHRMDQLVKPLCAALEPYLDRPYALFGHSMGALVAFEVARRLSDGEQPAPFCLIVSGRRGPRIASNRRILFGLPPDEFLAEVVRLGGMPQEILDQPDLLEILLPVLRADYELSETYQPLPGGRLRCPVAAYMGTADPEVELSGLRAWQEETSGEFTARVFPGDHFYLKSERANVLGAVREDLRNAAAGPDLAASAAGSPRRAPRVDEGHGSAGRTRQSVGR